VLLDLHMPALNGDEVVRLVRRNDLLSTTKIVLYSSKSAEELAELASACGADGVLQKQANPALLVELVNQWMKKPGEPEDAKNKDDNAPTPLFVDDDARLLRSYRRIFGNDLVAEYVDSPETALQKMLSSEPPDIVVTDVDMPGMSGVDLYNKAVSLDESWRGRVIFITGAGYNEDLQYVLAKDGATLLHKPVDRKRLTELIIETGARTKDV